MIVGSSGDLCQALLSGTSGGTSLGEGLCLPGTSLLSPALGTTGCLYPEPCLCQEVDISVSSWQAQEREATLPDPQGSTPAHTEPRVGGGHMLNTCKCRLGGPEPLLGPVSTLWVGPWVLTACRAPGQAGAPGRDRHLGYLRAQEVEVPQALGPRRPGHSGSPWVGGSLVHCSCPLAWSQQEPRSLLAPFSNGYSVPTWPNPNLSRAA